MSYDVIVVGAGVVGALTARELARYDLKVLVLEAEPDAAMGATKANSAIVHGGFAEGPETLKGRLCILGRRAFPQLEQELNFGFRVTGSLVVSFGADPAPLEKLLHRGLANGLTDLELWSGDRARDHEPHLRPGVTGALWCAGAGVCSPWDLAYAALENALAHGVDLKLDQRVVSVEGPLPGPGRWRLSTTDHSYDARFVINVAGLGGGRVDVLAGLNDSTLTPRTGEYLVFAPGTGSLVNSVIFQLPGPLGKGVLVGPTYQNNLLVGPDAHNEDPESGPEWRHTHVDRLAALVAQASAVVEGIDLKKAIRSFTGVRAGAPGGDFLVGAADPVGHPGWHRAVGIQSPGLTSSPALARLLVEGLNAEGLNLVPRPDFDPCRRPLAVHLSRRAPLVPFPQADALTRLPEGNPKRMVCRCEQIREADLEEAWSRGVPISTLDGLKRRTRAGMGWCQGRFCRPRVAAWLEARLGRPVPPEDDAARSGLHRVEGRDLWTLLKLELKLERKMAPDIKIHSDGSWHEARLPFRVPVFPTPLHKAAAGVVHEYFSKLDGIDTVLVVNSCARGQAVEDSDLDFAILAKSQVTPGQRETIQKKWDEFSLGNPILGKYKALSKFAHLHLDVISGEYTPTVLEVGVASDYFEVEIGNQVCYSAPLGEVGDHFRKLREKWLPFYDEKLRGERFAMTRDGCQYDLDHIPRFLARGLYFQAFDILWKAFQEYLQVLFIGRRVYPLAYNKWIRFQIETLLGDRELYQRLPAILSVTNIESDEMTGKVKMLQELLDQVELNERSLANPS